MGIPVRGATQGHAALGARAVIIFLAWLEAGYAVALALFAQLSAYAALWEAAACIAAIPLLLSAVIAFLALPKYVQGLPGSVRTAAWVGGGAAEIALPWLGWSWLLHLLNGGDLSWPAALRAGAAVALFSYLTGFLLLLRFRPRPRDVEVTRLEIPIRGLPEEFDGYQIRLWTEREYGIHEIFLPGEVITALMGMVEEIKAYNDLTQSEKP